MCNKWVSDVASVIPIKSSTYISMSFIRLSGGNIFPGVTDNILCSNSYGGRSGVLRRASIVSLAVSEAAQKNGGDSTHPICRLCGTTITVSSMSHVLPFFVSSSYQKLHASSLLTTIRQNASFILSLLNLKGYSLLFDICTTVCLIELPSCTIASSGDNLLVVSLTEG